MFNYFKNQKGFSQVLILLLLITGVAVGTVLTSQRTNFLPQADEDEKQSRVSSKKINTKTTKKVKEGQNYAQNQIGDNNFIFEFNNPSDTSSWSIQKDPFYYDLGQGGSTADLSKRVEPTDSGITDLRVEDGYLKFKKTNNRLNYVLGPQNLHIEVEKLRGGGYSESRLGIFRARAKIGNGGGGGNTSGITFNIHYYDDQNPSHLDPYLMYPFPVVNSSTIFSRISYDMFQLDEGFKKFPEETNKFLGPNTYIRGYSLTVGGFAGQEIWIDYFGFYDRYPEKPERGDKTWNSFPGF